MPGIWMQLAPELIAAGTALLILTVDTFSDEKRGKLASIIALLGVIAALAVTLYLSMNDVTAELFSGMIVLDGYALFLKAAVLVVTGLVVASSYEYISRHYPEGEQNITEMMALLMLAATGMLLMTGSRSLLTAFLSIELAALPSYALVGYMRRSDASIEAGMKYFLLGAFSSALLLFGISLIYGVTGELMFTEVYASIQTMETGHGVLGVGAILILAGFGFKVAAVPFHVWAPDAYQGAPTTVTAFISSASKIAGFALMITLFTSALQLNTDWVLIAQILAVTTMIYGNVVALVQSSVKRMLAYSSIGHAGYVLIALAVFSSLDSSASAFALGAGMTHLFVYGFMNTGAFLVVALVEDYWGVGHTFDDYAGLGRQVPFIGIAMAVFMLSLAGLPAGAGFLSKLVLFGAAVNAGFWWLALIGAIMSALSLYYYTKVLKYMWIEEPRGSSPVLEGTPTGIYAAIIAATAGTILLLVWFNPVISMAVESATGILFI